MKAKEINKKKLQHDHNGKDNCCQDEMIKNISNVIKNWRSGSKSSSESTEDRHNMLRNIQKRILHGSVQSIPPDCMANGGGLNYPKESKFTFHYRICKLDDQHTVLDDTREYGKTMELYSGKEFQIEFWEHCLATMLPGEVASFSVPPERLLPFPAVNKKLRDYMLNKQGVAVKHCCGFMGLQEQGGLGYPDLDELLVKPEPLEFIFDLINVDIPTKVRKETWIMSADERAAIVPVLREEGNQLYVSGEYEQAMAKYNEALGILEQLVLREKPGDPEWLELDKARVPLYTNLAQCLYKTKDYYAVIRNATEALSRDSNNIKALYRRSKAYSEVWDIDSAVEDMKKIAKLDPKMEMAMFNAIKLLETKLANYNMKERHRLTGKLNNLSFTNDASD